MPEHIQSANKRPALKGDLNGLHSRGWIELKRVTEDLAVRAVRGEDPYAAIRGLSAALQELVEMLAAPEEVGPQAREVICPFAEGGRATRCRPEEGTEEAPPAPRESGLRSM